MSARDDRPTESHSSPPAFIQGLDLSGTFYREAVQPILAEAYPGMAHAAALLGSGSEILGYDTARSTDHDWGPRLLLFLAEEDHATHAAALDVLFRERLPLTVRGYSTHFGDPLDDGARLLEPGRAGGVAHRIEIHSPRAYFRAFLGVDPSATLSAIDWLQMPRQALLAVTAGRVYHDGPGLLEPARRALAWYPTDVWRYVLAAQWARISQQEAFVGRTSEVGDELGSALIAADLTRDLMHLCFLIERRYAPYSKWVGTAFAHLACAPRLLPHLQGALAARDWHEREAHLIPAYEIAAEMHNALELAEPVDPRTRPFFTRPFRVLHAERFSDALLAAIMDPEMLAIIERAGLVGSIDQISDNVDLKTHADRCMALRALYENRQP